MNKAERLLQTYTFEELLEINDLTEEDVVACLIELEMLSFIRPVDYASED